MTLRLTLPVFFCCIFFSLQAGEKNRNNIPSEKRTYATTRISTGIVLDGLGNDPSWEQVEWQGDFIQHEPLSGRLPSQPTRFKLVYDNEYVYVLIHCLDASIDSIEERLSRRDEPDGDQAGIQFDSYNDKLTAFTFIVNVSGVKSDYLMSNDGDNEDLNWDPIWYVKTSIQDDGWMAEMKIPLSQLRFDQSQEQVWGLQVMRFIFRKQELSLWQHIPKDSPGWTHQFGSLHGIKDLKTRRQVEIAPYYVAMLTRNPEDAESPFDKRTQWDLTKIGVDGKLGISNNFIMDFTINPDFGQVEADPSEVNLTAFESYFEEKRPFFIEGKNLFTYSLMGGDGDFSEDGLFYSRRIGRRPQYDLDLDDNEYADMPEFTRILGAAKITGKTKDGLSVGILGSVTSREVATIDSAGKQYELAVEPLTTYNAARLQKEFDKGNTIIGGMFTSTIRDINDTHLEILPSAAYTGGLNFAHFWKEKKYYFTSRFLMSHVKGTPESMVSLQEASARYFQRPDANHTELDSARESLSGMAGRLEIGKTGGGHWRYAAFFSWKSPGFELNDMGYLRLADEISEIVWVGYRIWEPFSIFRNLNININQWREYNFDLIKALDGGNINFDAQFKNYWMIDGGVNVNSPIRYATMLRGGPMIILPAALSAFTMIQTDQRKKFIVGLEASKSWGEEGFSRSNDYALELFFKPANWAQLSLAPGYSEQYNEMQYVTTIDYTNDKRYIFGTIRQDILNLSLRLNVSFSPTMSIQYWGQPFVASGKYSAYKMVSNTPLAGEYKDRIHLFTPAEISYDETSSVWQIDENGDAAADYSFDKPDFKWSEYKSNLVFRWEFTPGSAFYFVWSQFRDYSGDTYDLAPSNDMHDLFNDQPKNIWLIKFSYRFRA